MKKLRNTLIFLVIAIQAFQLLGDDSFNCHNFAWESDRRWLDDPSMYIEAATECGPGDATKIVYYEGDTPIHSGVYLGNGWVKSKWGSNPVVVHPWNFSTYGTSVRFYK